MTDVVADVISGRNDMKRIAQLEDELRALKEDNDLLHSALEAVSLKDRLPLICYENSVRDLQLAVLRDELRDLKADMKRAQEKHDAAIKRWVEDYTERGDENEALRTENKRLKTSMAAELSKLVEEAVDGLRKDCQALELAAADANALVLSHEAHIDRLGKVIPQEEE